MVVVFLFKTSVADSDISNTSSHPTISTLSWNFLGIKCSISEVLPTNIIIVEGLFVLQDHDLRELLDIKVYVEADSDECFIRRLKRDQEERGRTVESIIEQYLATVKPMQEQFIIPTRKYADVIVLRGGENKVAINMVSNMISKFLEKEEKKWMKKKFY